MNRLLRDAGIGGELAQCGAAMPQCETCHQRAAAHAHLVEDFAVPARLAEKELSERTGQFWALTERGALAYRAGHYQDAINSAYPL